MGYSPWGGKESDTTECTHTSSLSLPSSAHELTTMRDNPAFAEKSFQTRKIGRKKERNAPLLQSKYES